MKSDKESPMHVSWSESLDAVDWRELETLYRLAPLGNKNADDLKTVFTNSRYRCFVHEDGKLIAAGRALADGADASYICDVAVLPTHQGKGIGKEIVKRLVDLSRDHRKIILYSVPGKEGFYRKLGFLRMLTAMAIFENPQKAIERGHLSAS
jgi:ribosomal protein S18 acetylase RimI-like enzyme